MAQETDVQKPRPTFGLEYTGEVQTDFKKLKSVNLLELGAQLPLTSKLSVELGSISVLTTDEDILTNCLQNFSSIDAPNIPLRSQRQVWRGRSTSATICLRASIA